MKIVKNENLESVDVKKDLKGNMLSGVKFDDILQEAIKSASISKNKSIGSPPVCSMSDVPFGIISHTEKTPLIERVEGFLDIFEDYQRRLGDSHVSVKDLYPFITRLEDETKNLVPFLSSLPEGDEVRDIINRILINTTVEIARFQRGDYLT